MFDLPMYFDNLNDCELAQFVAHVLDDAKEYQQ